MSISFYSSFCKLLITTLITIFASSISQRLTFASSISQNLFQIIAIDCMFLYKKLLLYTYNHHCTVALFIFGVFVSMSRLVLFMSYLCYLCSTFVIINHITLLKRTHLLFWVITDELSE